MYDWMNQTPDDTPDLIDAPKGMYNAVLTNYRPDEVGEDNKHRVRTRYKIVDVIDAPGLNGEDLQNVDTINHDFWMTENTLQLKVPHISFRALMTQVFDLPGDFPYDQAFETVQGQPVKIVVSHKANYRDPSINDVVIVGISKAD